MGNKTVISVKVDKDVRDRAQKTAKRLGLPLSTVVNAQLRQFAAERRIEFREPLVPNAKTAKLLRKIDADIRAGRNMSPAFDDAGEAIRWLHSGK